MHGDYVDAILRAYRHHAKTNPRFNPLRRDGLKEHCLEACSTRFNARDEIILRNFFGAADGQKGYQRLISNCSTDKFRPLTYFLKGKTAYPSSKYLELLAWMFDISPRPYNEQVDYTRVALYKEEDSPINYLSKLQEESSLRPSLEENGKLGTGIPIEREPVRVKKWEWNWKKIVAMLLVIAGLGTFSLLQDNKLSLQARESNLCMYWEGERYIKVDCSYKTDGVVLPFEQERYDKLKRITDPSIITRDMVGKVYYRKKNNKLKFYTAGGTDPEDMEGNLRPMSVYIYERYIEGKEPGATSKN